MSEVDEMEESVAGSPPGERPAPAEVEGNAEGEQQSLVQAAAGSVGTAAGSDAARGSAQTEGGSAQGEQEAKGKKETAQEAFKRLSKLAEKRGVAYWDYLVPVLVTEKVNGQMEEVCRIKCVRGGKGCVGSCSRMRT